MIIVIFRMPYCSPTWSVTKKQEIKLDRTYTRMLRAVLDLNWQTHPKINRLYGKLPRISSIIRERRTRFTKQSFRRRDVLFSDVLLWDPQHGTPKMGRPVKTYPKLLTEDTGVQIANLSNVVDNWALWKEIVNSVRATPPIWWLLLLWC